MKDVAIDVGLVSHPWTLKSASEIMAAYRMQDGALKLLRARSERSGNAGPSADLEFEGAKLGQTLLGVRRKGTEYTINDRGTPDYVAALVTRAIEKDSRSMT